METENKVWYVMRALFQTEMKTKAKLEQAGIQTYIPVELRAKTRKGRVHKTYMPIVRNLLFVYSDPQTLAPFLATDSKFQYTFRRGGRQNEPMIVPNDQMESFIQATEHSERPLYFSPDELLLHQGIRVRIMEGPLQGTIGILMKVKGARSKRLVLEIPDTLALAVEIDPKAVEPIAAKSEPNNKDIISAV